jgi:PTS system galactitol-specific IIC component
VAYLKWIGAGVLTLITIGMVVWNRLRIARENKNAQ